LGGGGGGEEKDFFKIFPFVPNRFSSGSQSVPHGCSQSHLALIPYVLPKVLPPLLTYIGGPKGEALHISIESSILGSLHSFNIVLQWAKQIPQKKVGLVRGIAQAKNCGELFWE